MSCFAVGLSLESERSLLEAWGDNDGDDGGDDGKTHHPHAPQLLPPQHPPLLWLQQHEHEESWMSSAAILEVLSGVLLFEKLNGEEGRGE